MATFLDKWIQVGLVGFVGWQVLPQETRESIQNLAMEVLDAAAASRPLPPPQTPLALPPPDFSEVPIRPFEPLPVAELPKDWRTTFANRIKAKYPQSTPATAPKLILTDDPDRNWRDVVPHPSVVLVVGKRGSGKSALAYRLLELMKLRARPYAVGVPTSAHSKLPEWIGIASSIEDLPQGSVAVIDEAYLHFHSRESMAKQGRSISGLVNLSRQRDQTLIFVSQEARQIDRNIASSANVVVFKQPGMLQAEFERPELRHLAEQAKTQLSAVTGDVRRWAYVYSPDADHLGLLENELPSFWKPSLSKAFASGGAPARDRPAERVSPSDRATAARQLREQSRSYKQIALELGVSKATVVNYLRDYPYRGR